MTSADVLIGIWRYRLIELSYQSLLPNVSGIRSGFFWGASNYQPANNVKDFIELLGYPVRFSWVPNPTYRVPPIFETGPIQVTLAH